MGRSASSWSQNGVRKGQWTPEEDQKLVEFMAQRDDVSKGCKWRNVPKVTGLNKWSALAKHLPGRTDKRDKKLLACRSDKEARAKGHIDPVTHQPPLHIDGLHPEDLDNLQHLLDAACNNAINNLTTNPSQLRALRSQLLPDHNNDIDKVIQMLNTILQLLESF